MEITVPRNVNVHAHSKDTDKDAHVTQNTVEKIEKKYRYDNK